MITISLWCTGLLTNSMPTCAQKVPLVKKWVNYMPRKGVKLQIGNFTSPSPSSSSSSSSSCSGSTGVSH